MVLLLAKAHYYSENGGLSGPKLWYPIAMHEREPLPAPEVARIYITCKFSNLNSKLLADPNYVAFFKTLNKTFPLFDEDVFEQDFACRPDPSPSEDTSWYAALNMVFAISCATGSLEEDPFRPVIDASELVCWRYFRNASSLYVDLSFQDSNLMTVQAMLAMVRWSPHYT
jgi:hypothetical protein